MDNNIHIPLDLPDVRIVEISKTESKAWLIRVESTLNGTQCRKCGESTSNFHGLDEPLRLRHLPLFEVPVYIEIRPKRYRCPRCAYSRDFGTLFSLTSAPYSQATSAGENHRVRQG